MGKMTINWRSPRALFRLLAAVCAALPDEAVSLHKSIFMSLSV